MASKRKVLELLKRSELTDIADRLDVAVADRRSKDALVEGLAKSRRTTPEDILSGLGRDRLKELCRSLGLDDSGREKAVLAERITGGAAEAPRPEPRRAPKKKPERQNVSRAKPPEEKKVMAKAKKTKTGADRGAKDYSHPESTTPLRPEIGTQTSFKKKKPPATYRYDSSIAPELVWDEGATREHCEVLIKQILDSENVEQAKSAAAQLRAMSKPFLNWAGKAERSEINVPTLPLFIHERLSTKAIIETLGAHKSDKQLDLMSLFADPRHSIHDQVLRAYEHRDQWVNRFVLGDSLVVMNSLLKYEDLGGQVQMIYMDPPYCVKFGSNFQPFVRNKYENRDGKVVVSGSARDVSNNDDEDFTREPEMVQAYRDTWELGLHSYLTYLRDRLLLCRDLLAPTGSVFVQISDENLHHVREVMDEVYGSDNFCGLIAFRTTGGQSSALLSTSTDFLLWYAREKERAKSRFHNPTIPKLGGKDDGSGQYTWVEPNDGEKEPRPMTKGELDGSEPIPEGWRILAHDTLYSQGAPSDPTELKFKWRGTVFWCPPNTHWKPGVKSGGMQRLADANRLMLVGNTLRYRRYLNDFPVYVIDNVWNDTAISGFGRKKEYVVETSTKVIQRCLLMTTDPGDLVLDPTCGSGTTALVAEEWGRRWITADTSRVPLALAKQRLITASFDYYELQDDKRGPAGGFVYKRKQNNKGEEIGGIVPHITLGSIANDEPSAEEILVDRPEVVRGIARVTGPFVVEATIPTPVDWEGDGEEDSGAAGDHAEHVSRMIEVLRLSPVLQLAGNKSVTLAKVRAPARTLNLSAEAEVPGAGGQRVAIVIGPQNGAVSETLVYNAAKEANAKGYAQLYVIGFAIHPDARESIERCADLAGIPATYIQATPDLLMGDLLKNMRSSQVFSVCGLPEIEVHKVKGKDHAGELQVELLGLDVFDPATMRPGHVAGADLPAWFLDTNYNGSCFHVCQAFFPRTGAWEKIKKALRSEYDQSVWEHLSGTVSAPFLPGDHERIAVKVIDVRGNELMVSRIIPGAKK